MVDIDRICNRLADAGVAGVAQFRSKLTSNYGCEPVVMALLFEAKTALMFAGARCGVEMRESPDLEVTLGAHRLFVEVKHFRRKPQDDIDDERLRGATSLLLPYGDTHPAEGRDAWDQVADVACRKVHQYQRDVPNVLVINSSSPNCIDELIIPTAVNRIDKICRMEPDHGLRRLNGIVLVSEEVAVRRGIRNVHFFETMFPAIPLPKEIRAMLDGVNLWRGG